MTDVVTSTAPIANAATFGTQGPVGPASYTTTTASFVQPAAGGTVSVTMGSNAWFAIGQTLYVSTGGSYVVSTKTGTTIALLVNTSGATGNASPGATIASGSSISAGGVQGGAGATAVVTVLDTSAVDALGAGFAACVAAAGYAGPTNNLDPGACHLIGCTSGTPGQLLTGVVANAPFTTEGGPPGKVAWLASTSDDNGTGAGRFTGTRPQSAPIPLITENFSGRAPKNVVEACEVLDDTLWASQKTCVVRLRPGAGPRAILPPDEVYQGWQYGGFSNSIYLSTPANTANCMIRDGESLAFLFTLDAATVGQYPFQLFDTALNGWALAVAGSASFQIYNAGVVVANLVMGPPKAGRNAIIVTVSGSTVYGTMVTIPNNATTGAPYVAHYSAPVTGTIPSSIGGTGVGFRIGSGYTQGKCSAWLKLGALSASERGRLVQCIIPVPPTDPFHFPDWALQHPSLQLQWHADGTVNLYAQDGNITFNFVPVGAPVRTARTARRIRDTRAMFLDTEPVETDSNGFPHPSSFALTEINNVPADAQDIYLGGGDDDPYDWDNDTPLVSVDGTYYPANSAFGNPDGRIRGQWLCIHSRDLAGATHNVKIMSGGRTSVNVAGVTAQGTAVPAGFATSSFRVTEIVTSNEPTFGTSIPGQATTVVCNKRLVLIGDDLFESHDMYLAANGGGGIVSRIRAVFPTAGGPGRVSAESATGRSLLDMAIAGGFGAGYTATTVPVGAVPMTVMMPYARMIVRRGDEGGAAQANVRYVIEDVQTGRYTPTVMASLLGGLIDAIHSLRPSSLIGLCLIPYPSGAANAFGFTIAQYNTAIAAVATARVAFMNAAKDLSGPNALTQINPGVNGNLDGPGGANFVLNIASRAPEWLA